MSGERIYELAMMFADHRAFEVLDEGVNGHFERYDTAVAPFGGNWYDLARLRYPQEECATEEIADALEYLNLRGLLEAHPTVETFVRRKVENDRS